MKWMTKVWIYCQNWTQVCVSCLFLAQNFNSNRSSIHTTRTRMDLYGRITLTIYGLHRSNVCEFVCVYSGHAVVLVHSRDCMLFVHTCEWLVNANTIYVLFLANNHFDWMVNNSQFHVYQFDRTKTSIQWQISVV